jgi:hypothetical protein
VIGDSLFLGDEPFQLVLFRLELGALGGDLSVQSLAPALQLPLAALDLPLAT